MRSSEHVTQARLVEVLDYNPATGVFKWRRRNGRTAGTYKNDGYIQIRVDGRFYRAHRLAFLYVHGYIPEFLDHRNRVRDDNRIDNLRPASKGDNRQNASMSVSNTSGRIGVSLYKRTGKWQAQIKVNKVSHHLGWYVTPDEAEEAYLSAKRRLHTFAPTLDVK